MSEDEKRELIARYWRAVFAGGDAVEIEAEGFALAVQLPEGVRWA